ncbi:hypothetical protein OENI_190015 [Oenococcus oeni]|uniref:Uncharacterized protein n=1 Tax=Oenococcus oeni TaxID=1247 RepID=A0AAQ2URF1_OENOE|nr:hypothetical protein OENI_190015 [Oenococcus oeni]SYW05727.1 hypothetical protein OENI_1400002 [Oenococcus oeni]SYW08765.1 hypothetical protein OENI_380016 [Oenococcus oeni]SYW10323.1 hypothetical protein OENI_210003 [Oenococcus oeni]SYW12302.1 hypothetical protein OENI_200022 [Oenococcus oeni]
MNIYCDLVSQANFINMSLFYGQKQRSDSNGRYVQKANQGYCYWQFNYNKRYDCRNNFSC